MKGYNMTCDPNARARTLSRMSETLAIKLRRINQDSVDAIRMQLEDAFTLGQHQALSTILPELIEDWKSEIEEFATHNDSYYNAVRQCIQDLEAVIPEPNITVSILDY